jgi:hypothetical protein
VHTQPRGRLQRALAARLDEGQPLPRAHNVSPTRAAREAIGEFVERKKLTSQRVLARPHRGQPVRVVAQQINQGASQAGRRHSVDADDVAGSNALDADPDVPTLRPARRRRRRDFGSPGAER